MLIPDFLRISCEKNSGIALGLGAEWSGLWTAVSIIAVIGLVAGFYSIYNLRWTMTLAMGFLLGGAAGNTFDRIADGSVRDFMGIFLAGSGGAEGGVVFNFADLSLVAGAFFMVVDLLLARKPESGVHASLNVRKRGVTDVARLLREPPQSAYEPLLGTDRCVP